MYTTRSAVWLEYNLACNRIYLVAKKNAYFFLSLSLLKNITIRPLFHYFLITIIFLQLAYSPVLFVFSSYLATSSSLFFFFCYSSSSFAKYYSFCVTYSYHIVFFLQTPPSSHPPPRNFPLITAALAIFSPLPFYANLSTSFTCSSSFGYLMYLFPFDSFSYFTCSTTSVFFRTYPLTPPLILRAYPSFSSFNLTPSSPSPFLSSTATLFSFSSVPFFFSSPTPPLNHFSFFPFFHVFLSSSFFSSFTLSPSSFLIFSPFVFIFFISTCVLFLLLQSSSSFSSIYSLPPPHFVSASLPSHYLSLSIHCSLLYSPSSSSSSSSSASSSSSSSSSNFHILLNELVYLYIVLYFIRFHFIFIFYVIIRIFFSSLSTLFSSWSFCCFNLLVFSSLSNYHLF
ncbi:unnamed protein product [Acanthosepion pharaonis]|uniref:Uncharacterized protein n=1 Tax=Acanthosepion pharaonis TaxID=158019 RepID=A0A812BPT5_ACAPH|nr:unnamed protein product [Sepia pharaonis]